MLPHEASHFYDWTPACKLTYDDFLRVKQFESAIRYEIDNQSRQVIATNQQLSERGIEVLSDSRGFTMLSQEIGRFKDAAREGSAEFGAAFHWGFSEALVSQGQMNIPLAELLGLIKTPAHTWACEQFEIGRDEFRRQLYPEALQSATRAIEGMESNPGVKTEFRFHFLVGVIRLGSYTNTSSEVVNPRLAQQAFLTAARCAQALFPADAGLSLICAGRAAFVDGDMDSAIAHTRKGLSLLPTHALGMYQLGRALFLKGGLSEATDRLADAILLNVEHALHASGDPDFLAKTDFLNGVLRQALERYGARNRQVAERFRRAEQTLRSFSFEDTPADALELKGLAEIQKTHKAAEAMATTKTLFAYSAAINQLQQGFRLFPICFEEFKAQCVLRLQEKIMQPPHREDFSHADAAAVSQANQRSSRTWLASGLASGVTIFLVQSCQTAPPIYRGILESMLDLLLIPFIYAVSIGAAVALLENIYREYTRAKYRSALAAYDAAWYAYSNLKNKLENEIAGIRGLRLPKECAPPANATNATQPSATADAPAASKHVGPWARL